jgi:hypothetical protein
LGACGVQFRDTVLGPGSGQRPMRATIPTQDVFQRSQTSSLYQNAQTPSACHLHRESEARSSCHDDVSCLR